MQSEIEIRSRTDECMCLHTVQSIMRYKSLYYTTFPIINYMHIHSFYRNSESGVWFHMALFFGCVFLLECFSILIIDV